MGKLVVLLFVVFWTSNLSAQIVSFESSGRLFDPGRKSFLVIDRDDVSADRRDKLIRPFDGDRFVRLHAVNSLLSDVGYLTIKIDTLKPHLNYNFSIKYTNSIWGADRNYYLRKLDFYFSSKIPVQKTSEFLSVDGQDTLVRVNIKTNVQGWEEIDFNFQPYQQYRYVTIGLFNNSETFDEIYGLVETPDNENHGVDIYYYFDFLTLKERKLLDETTTEKPKYNKVIFLFDISTTIFDIPDFANSLYLTLDKYIKGIGDLKLEGVAYRDTVIVQPEAALGNSSAMFDWLDLVLKNEKVERDNLPTIELGTRNNKNWEEALEEVDKKVTNDSKGVIPIIYISDMKDGNAKFNSKLKAKVLEKNKSDSSKNLKFHFVKILNVESKSSSHQRRRNKFRKKNVSSEGVIQHHQVHLDLKGLTEVFKNIFDRYLINIEGIEFDSGVVKFENTNVEVSNDQKDLRTSGLWLFNSDLRKELRRRGIFNRSKLKKGANGEIIVKGGSPKVVDPSSN